ncbi:MAG: S1C family serine protease [Candidatus Sumerlaeaceae bacterium]
MDKKTLGKLFLFSNLGWLILFLSLVPSNSGLFGIVSLATGAVNTSASSRASARRTEIVEAAEKVSPSIVSVGASRTSYMVSPFFDFFSDFALFPYQEKIPYLGSGVIVSRDGLIVTNYHVIEQAEDVFVTLSDGRELQANVIAADSVLDLAVLKVSAMNLPAIKMGDSDDLMVGEWVLAMGNPFGNLIGDPHPTVTVGVVSALKRSFRSGGPSPKVYQDMIQTDAAINPGNSGGALVNVAGELVGINTFIVSRSGGSIGIGFAIPVNRVKALVDEVTKYGRLRPKLIDFRVQNVNARIARILGSGATSGAVVAEIQRNGPAYRAGLRVGDIITSVNGHEIHTTDDIFANIWAQPLGTPIKCQIDRGGRKLTIEFQVSGSDE